MRDRIQIRKQNLVSGKESDDGMVSVGADNGSLCRHLRLEDATALYMFLLPKGLARLKPQVLDPFVEHSLPKGNRLRVVTYMFQVRGWTPAIVDNSTKGNIKLYSYHFGP